MTPTIRVCRLCGTPTALEPWEHTAADPWACESCLGELLEHGPHIPAWAVRQARPLRAVP